MIPIGSGIKWLLQTNWHWPQIKMNQIQIKTGLKFVWGAIFTKSIGAGNLRVNPILGKKPNLGLKYQHQLKLLFKLRFWSSNINKANFKLRLLKLILTGMICIIQKLRELLYENVIDFTHPTYKGDVCYNLPINDKV